MFATSLGISLLLMIAGQRKWFFSPSGIVRVDTDGVEVNPHDFLTLARDRRDDSSHLKPRDDAA